AATPPDENAAVGPHRPPPSYFRPIAPAMNGPSQPASPSPMHRLLAAAFCLVLLPSVPALAQPSAAPAAAPADDNTGDLAIAWEVRNRFRLFREERDFTLHLEAMRDGTILAAEERLAVQSDGRGWARNTV